MASSSSRDHCNAVFVKFLLPFFAIVRFDSIRFDSMFAFVVHGEVLTCVHVPVPASRFVLSMSSAAERSTTSNFIPKSLQMSICNNWNGKDGNLSGRTGHGTRERASRAIANCQTHNVTRRRARANEYDSTVMKSNYEINPVNHTASGDNFAARA